MLVTLDTSHFEMSPLKVRLESKIVVISVTDDTSQFPIGPCGLLEQSPGGDCLRHAPMALLSCTLDCGTNAGFAGGAEQWDSVLIIGMNLEKA